MTHLDAQARYSSAGTTTGKTPLRDGTYARDANLNVRSLALTCGAMFQRWPTFLPAIVSVRVNMLSSLSVWLHHWQSFAQYEPSPEAGPVVLATNERVVSTERLAAQVVEQPILVPDFRIVERAVQNVKPITRTTTHEQVSITEVPQQIQIVKEVPVERIVEKEYTRKVLVERIIEQVVEVVKDVPIERIVEQVVEVVKEVPVEKVVERVQIQEIPVVETEERVVEVVREIPVEVVKEVPVYIKVDPTEWDSRHNLRSAQMTAAFPTGTYTSAQAQQMSYVQQPTLPAPTSAPALVPVRGVGMRLARYGETGTRTYVCEIVPNSPAEESRQIAVNDMLTAVDGRDVSAMTLDQINDMIRGPVGTSVVLDMTSERAGFIKVSLSRRSYGYANAVTY